MNDDDHSPCARRASEDELLLSAGYAARAIASWSPEVRARRLEEIRIPIDEDASGKQTEEDLWKELADLPEDVTSSSEKSAEPRGADSHQQSIWNWLKAFLPWFGKVDIGLRPREVFSGTDVNLYPLSRHGFEWIERNIDQFDEPIWSRSERCLRLSKADSHPAHLRRLVIMLKLEGLTLRFYGRLKQWDGGSSWCG
jgi:hypothetical protein